MKPNRNPSPPSSPPGRVSDAEWEVLDVLWTRGEVSASQITTTLKPKTNWSLGAVRSFLTRLINKGIVELLDDEPIYRYRSIYDRETLIRQESTGFFEKFFGGSLPAVVAYYLKNEGVSHEELGRLKKMLKDYEKEA